MLTIFAMPVVAYLIGFGPQFVCIGSKADCRKMQQQICDQEKHTPNFELRQAKVLTGTFKDETGAFFNSRYAVQLRSAKTGEILATSRLGDTGNFRFDGPPAEADRLVLVHMDTGKPERSGFIQAPHLECGVEKSCNLDVVLKGSPTDQPTSACPAE